MLAFLFLAFIAGAVFFHKLPRLILGIYLGASCVAFLAYWTDKSAAQNDRWRTNVSEERNPSVAGFGPIVSGKNNFTIDMRLYKVIFQP